MTRPGFLRAEDLRPGQIAALLPETDEVLLKLGLMGTYQGIRVWKGLSEPCEDHIMELGREHCVECGPPDDPPARKPPPAQFGPRLEYGTLHMTGLSPYAGLEHANPHDPEAMTRVVRQRMTDQLIAGMLEGGKRDRKRLFPDRHPRLHRMLRRWRWYYDRQLRRLGASYG